MKPNKDYVKKHRDLAAKSGLKRVEATIHASRVAEFRSLVADMRQPVDADRDCAWCNDKNELIEWVNNEN